MLKSKPIILSVKPKWADLILNGKKKVELRRSFSRAIPNDTYVLIYASAPVSALVGLVQLELVDNSPLNLLWSKYGDNTGASRSEFNEYLKGKNTAIALVLKKPIRISEINLNKLRNQYNFTPPVSWRFIKEHELEIIRGLI